MPEVNPVKRVAVIGAGTIGASWAAYFLSRGLEIAVSDPKGNGEDFVRRFIAGAWPNLVRLGLADGASSDRWKFFANPVAACDGAEFVQESGPENEDIKTSLFAQLGAAVPRDVLIASSSSGLLMSKMQSRCPYPERCVIGHPFNPPHLVPLVEVVGGARTSAQTIDRAMGFYRQIGKHPIHVRKEVRGHIANRLQAAIFREVGYLLQENVASAADIDAAVTYGPGLRWAWMGPAMTFHVGGGEGGMTHFIDHIGGAVQGWWDDLGAPDMTPALRQKYIEGTADEAAGRSVAELAAARDEFLIELQQLLARLRAK